MNINDLDLRRVAVCLSGLVYWGGVLVQARRVRRKIGRSPNLKPRGSREKALWFGWFVVILVWIGQPLLLPRLGSLADMTWASGLLGRAGLIAGLALLLLGYAGTLWCYAAMGSTWRIGVNAQEKTTLVRTGPYVRVRHPIYGFQIVMLTGAALLLPTVLSFAILVFHYACALVKARDEERYLTSVHGDSYRQYQAASGALFPRLFRSRS